MVENLRFLMGNFNIEDIIEWGGHGMMTQARYYHVENLGLNPTPDSVIKYERDELATG